MVGLLGSEWKRSGTGQVKGEVAIQFVIKIAYMYMYTNMYTQTHTHKRTGKHICIYTKTHMGKYAWQSWLHAYEEEISRHSLYSP